MLADNACMIMHQEEPMEKSQRHKFPYTFDPPLRRSSRVRKQPDWFHGLVASGEQQDPSTVAEALFHTRQVQVGRGYGKRDGINPL